MDESALIASALRGDAESLNRLVDRHQEVAYNVAYRLLGDADAAAEVTQEAVLAAHRALPALPHGSFRAWLLRSVVRACRRRLRPGRSCLRMPAHDPLEVGEYTSERGCRGGSAEALVERAVQAGIAGLPLESWVVLVLADVQGLSYEEIAQVTGASPAAVGRRLGRARAGLREWLDGGSG